ncbi:hypothetical protein FRC12_008674 [Ceratobasidium sp. 428]|nr:hypothetical protein FRC12_008674 [Ceratobasidium sp. 428]
MLSVPLNDAFSQLDVTQNQLILALSAFHGACAQLYETAIKVQSTGETYSALDDRLGQMGKRLDSLSVTEEELAQSHSFLRRTRNISKTMIPINRLPGELLAHIFELVVSHQYTTKTAKANAQPNALATIPSVCHSWRQLAIRTPRLWTYIDLTGYNHPASMLNRATLWSQRARDVPVHLRLTRFRFFEDQELPSELRNISTRAVSFIISPPTDEAYIRDFFNHYDLLGRSNTLQMITMWPTRGPKLSSHVDWSRFLPDTLTSLKLDHTSANITPTLDELMSLLSRTRNLHTLILRNVPVASGSRTSYPEIHLPHLEYLESYPHHATRPSYSGVTKQLMQSIVPGPNDIEAWVEMGEPDDDEHDSAMHRFFTRSRVTRLHTGYFKPEDHLLLARYLDCLPELRFLSLDFDGKPTNNVLDALVIPVVEGEGYSARCPKLQGLRLSEACIIQQSQAQLKRIIETHEMRSLIFGERAYFVDESGNPCDDSEIMDWLRERVNDLKSSGQTWFSLGA